MSAAKLVRNRPTGATAAAAGVAGILGGFAGLQVALAAGAPLGEHVWGGTQDAVLPTPMRLASVGAAAALTAMAAIVVRRAGLVGAPARRRRPRHRHRMDSMRSVKDHRVFRQVQMRRRVVPSGCHRTYCHNRSKPNSCSQMSHPFRVQRYLCSSSSRNDR